MDKEHRHRWGEAASVDVTKTLWYWWHLDFTQIKPQMLPRPQHEQNTTGEARSSSRTAGTCVPEMFFSWFLRKSCQAVPGWAAATGTAPSSCSKLFKRLQIKWVFAWYGLKSGGTSLLFVNWDFLFSIWTRIPSIFPVHFASKEGDFEASEVCVGAARVSTAHLETQNEIKASSALPCFSSSRDGWQTLNSGFSYSQPDAAAHN